MSEETYLVPGWEEVRWREEEEALTRAIERMLARDRKEEAGRKEKVVGREEGSNQTDDY
jgi:DNA-binding PadR family transcriptional regulator